jgi:adenylate kinase family enzyme
VQRVWVVGTSGSGKTTLARELAWRLGLPHTELDALYWGPGWTPREDFLADVARAVGQDTWVIDGNYSGAGAADLIRERADTFVFVDPSRATVMRRVVTRTLRRTAGRTQLWNGNREPWAALFARDSVIRWAWTTYAGKRAAYTAAASDPAYAHLAYHRLRTRADREALLAAVH